MRHSVNELYKINSKEYYTKEAAEELCTKEDKINKVSYVVNKDVVKVKTLDGIKEIYFYGGKTWFDTKEERDIYREEANKEYAEMVSRNKVIKAITEKLKGMTEEELNKLLQTLWEVEKSTFSFDAMLYRIKALKPRLLYHRGQ